MAADHFCLRWNNYQSNMVSELDILRTEEYLVDVTLCVESQKFRAHKVILSACSPYFRNVFKENPCEHPVVILKDVSPDDVEALLSFVYQGVVYVSEKKLCSFLQTAELLQIKGLVGAASTLNDEQAKAAIAAGQTGSGTGGGNGQSPVKRRKGAPVRIVKQEDGSVGEEPTLGGQLEPDDSSSPQHNDYSHDMMYDMKNEDDEVSNEDSEGEAGLGGGSGDSNGGYPPSGERLGMPVEAEERLGAVQSIPGLGPQPVQRQLSQGLPLPSPVPPQQSSILSGQFQVPVSGQPPLQELLTPPGTESRNGRRPCPLCTKVISNKSNLLKHMRIRHSDAYNPASCNLCNKIFKNKYSLRAHLNIYHKEYIAPPSGGSGGTPPQQPQPQQQQMQVQVQQAGQLAQFPVSSLPGLDQIHQPQYHQLPTGV